ncbi:F-box/LRR-repeat protein 21 isoform X1 [Diachasma alloeum]|uniref:F-box/LRR-repeat protein 21 isoform X1 n=1 Tax=Diachasma alloeum TaxID=454923 RepID=UPI0007382F0F|nr:F-box/LRR-repeat protein 21 isoform X1 [Diachasma alloeum]XP_015117054.1 F-box/LRR-repeat protein 21 isoform X1 [Diachasma alloeum]
MLECEKISETFSTLPPDKLNFESLVIEENSEDSNCWRDEVLKDLRKLQRLRVEDSSKISADDLAKIIKEGYSLRELCLSYSQLTEDLLRVIARENVSLQTMRIEAHSDTKPLARISDTAWTALQTHSPNLNLVMTCYLEDDEDYEVVLAPPITHLYLGGSPSSHVIRRVSENCPRLVELVINSCSSGVIDNELLTTARDCPELSAIGLAAQHSCNSRKSVSNGSRFCTCGKRLSSRMRISMLPMLCPACPRHWGDRGHRSMCHLGEDAVECIFRMETLYSSNLKFPIFFRITNFGIGGSNAIFSMCICVGVIDCFSTIILK